MLRRRIHLDRIPLHSVQRGHNREPCFFGEEDYFTYLHWLGKALRETGCVLHAYALMTNHVHLLLTSKKAERVPKLIISLGRRYVQYVNTSYRRPGTLWDSHYKSSPIQAETYLLACMRYIELNPVRATMVEDPRTTVGPATGPTSSDRPHRFSSLIRSSLHWARPKHAAGSLPRFVPRSLKGDSQ